MELQFVFSVVVVVVMLYAPSYLLLRACKLQRLAAIVFGPLVTIPFIALLASGYYTIGVPCNWLTLILPLSLISIAAYAVRKVLQKRAKPQKVGRHGVATKGAGLDEWGFGDYAEKQPGWYDPAILACYVLVGILLGCLVFLPNQDSLDALFQGYDSLHHLNVLRAFMETGQFTLFDVNKYMIPSEYATAPITSSHSGYYPTAWHMIGALASQLTSSSILLTANVTTFTSVFIVFPASMFAFFRQLFWRNPPVVMIGVVTVFAFTYFPWFLLAYGPLYPNMLSLALWPAFASLFMAVFNDSEGVAAWIRGLVFIVVGATSLAMAHPNSIILSVVVFTPFLAYWAFKRMRSHGFAVWKGLVVSIAIIVAACGLWYGLYDALVVHGRFMANGWDPYTTPDVAWTEALTLTQSSIAPQVVTGVFLYIGIASAFVWRRYLWLPVAYFLLMAMFVSGAGSEGLDHSLLSGFWYADTARILASMAIVGMPLAALGMFAVADIASRILAKVRTRHPVNTAAFTEGAGAALALVFAVLVFFPAVTATPNFYSTAPFDVIAAKVDEAYTARDGSSFGVKEREFIQKVKEKVPEGALIINQPNDGSAFAAATGDLNLWYHDGRHTGGSDETEESKIIRDRLIFYAKDKEVQEAVEKTGAKYVLLLDAATYSTGRRADYMFSYTPDLWMGIDYINSYTPGFRAVLSDGNMRLYEIVDAEEFQTEDPEPEAMSEANAAAGGEGAVN